MLPCYFYDFVVQTIMKWANSIGIGVQFVDLWQILLDYINLINKIKH